MECENIFSELIGKLWMNNYLDSKRRERSVRGADGVSMTLRIAVIAPSFEIGNKCIEDMLGDTRTIYKTRYSGEYLTEDAILYRNISTLKYSQIAGSLFDQLIIVDDSRKQVIRNQRSLVCMVKQILGRSYVPHKFQVQFYKMPKGM